MTALSEYHARTLTRSSFMHAAARKPVQSYLELLLSVRAIVQPHFQQKAQMSSGHYIVRISVHLSTDLETMFMFPLAGHSLSIYLVINLGKYLFLTSLIIWPVRLYHRRTRFVGTLILFSCSTML